MAPGPGAGTEGTGSGAPRISLVIPAYNEEENLPRLWEALRGVLEGIGVSWEVVLVDDGSTDGSLRAMQAIRRSDPRVRVLALERNRGQSAAFWCGFQRARGEILMTMDADLQNDPLDLPLLLKALEGFDAAIGWRYPRLDPFQKRAASRFANGVRNWLTGEEVHDVGCSLKAFRREVLEHVYPFRGMHRFYPTLFRIAGFKVTEVKVRHHPRTHGRSKYGTWNRLVGPFFDCLAVRWMKKRYIGRTSGKEMSDA